MITALSATPPVATAATAQDRAELLLRLQQRRSELIDALAVGLVDVQDRPLAPSIVAPLAVVQAAIDAVAAELGDADAAVDQPLRGHPRQIAVDPLDIGCSAAVVTAPESTP